jgi:predicted dienelactone hydrolase
MRKEETTAMRRYLLGLIPCLWAAGMSDATAIAGEASIVVNGTKVVVWEDGPAREPRPVIIFSHGFHGCATQSRFLTAAFAADGYLVFAPNHRDATCGGGTAGWLDRPQMPFQDPAQWSDATYRDRADDIRRLIDGLKTDAQWRDRADWSRLGLVGHSLGGYTVLGLAGGWPGWKLDGVKAVLALAPYTAPFAWRRTLNGLAAPVMYEGGLHDRLIDAGWRGVLGSYDGSPAPKYYVALSDADHFAWTDLHPEMHEPILAESLAFMDHYMKGAPPAALLTQSMPGVATLHYQSELGEDLARAGRQAD